MALYRLQILMSVFLWHASGHVRLTFPPARTYDLDFLNYMNSDPPCGFPTYAGAPRTTLVAGTRLDVSWHLAYPHQGGAKIEIIEESPLKVVYSLTDGKYMFQNFSTLQHADVILPIQYSCDNCVIRLLREASEWGSEYLFWSCADVTIIPHPKASTSDCSKRKKSRVERQATTSVGLPPDARTATNNYMDNDLTRSGATTPFSQNASDPSPTTSSSSQNSSDPSPTTSSSSQNSSDPSPTTSSTSQNSSDPSPTTSSSSQNSSDPSPTTSSSSQNSSDPSPTTSSSSQNASDPSPTTSSSSQNSSDSSPTTSSSSQNSSDPSPTTSSTSQNSSDPSPTTSSSSQNSSDPSPTTSSSSQNSSDPSPTTSPSSQNSSDPSPTTSSSSQNSSDPSPTTSLTSQNSSDPSPTTSSTSQNSSTLPPDARTATNNYMDNDLTRSGATTPFSQNSSDPSPTTSPSSQNSSDPSSTTSSTSETSAVAQSPTSMEASSTQSSIPTDGTTQDPCILQSPLPYTSCFEGKCLNGGICNEATGNCTCQKLFSGDRCEKQDQCWENSDCNYGKCIDTRSTTHPKLVCYCESRWYGDACDIKSSVELQTNYSSNTAYLTRVIRPELYTIHWKFVDDEIEIVAEARTLSWVGIGWKPTDMSYTCKEFPQALKEASGSIGTGNDLGKPMNKDSSFYLAPIDDPEMVLEDELARDTELGCDNSPARESPAPSEPSSAKNQKITLFPMDCSDIVIGSVKGNLHRVQDMYTRDRSTPRPDSFYLGTDDVTGAAGSQVDGVTTIVFRKKIQATHPSDHSIGHHEMKLIWAMGQNVDDYTHSPESGLEACTAGDYRFYRHDELKYHGTGEERRGTLEFNFHAKSSLLTNPRVSEVGQFMRPSNCSTGLDGFNCNLLASWNYNETTDLIRFTLKFPFASDHWVAIGFSSTRNMTFSDVIVGWITPEREIVVQDRWAGGNTSLSIDQSNDISNVSASVVHNVAIIQFFRLRITNDPRDVIFSKTDCWYFLLASGKIDAEGNLQQHGWTPTASNEKICVQSIKQSMEKVIQFTSNIRLEGAEFTPGLLQPTSIEFRKFKAEIEQLLRSTYQQLNLKYLRSAVDVKVKSFRPGSVRVQYIVSAIYDPTIAQTIDSIENDMAVKLNNYVKSNGNHLVGSALYVTVLGKVVEDEAPFVSFRGFSGEQAKSAAIFIGSISILIVLVQLLKVVQTKLKGDDDGIAVAPKQSHEDEAADQYHDINVDDIYKNIFEAIKRRQSFCSHPSSLSTSSAAELKQSELLSVRRRSLFSDVNETQSEQGVLKSHRSHERKSSFHTAKHHHQRPCSARGHRRASLILRKSTSAKAFASKTSFDTFLNESNDVLEKNFRASGTQNKPIRHVSDSHISFISHTPQKLPALLRSQSQNSPFLLESGPQISHTPRDVDPQSSSIINVSVPESSLLLIPSLSNVSSPTKE